MLHSISKKEPQSKTAGLHDARAMPFRTQNMDRVDRVLQSLGALELGWREQFYAWGRDILHEEGNLLIRYGLDKLPRNGEEQPFSEYTWSGVVDRGTRQREHLSRHEIHIWAFGMYSEIESVGGLYYSRASLRPWLVPSAPKPIPKSHDRWVNYLSRQTCPRFGSRSPKQRSKSSAAACSTGSLSTSTGY